jgi:hypothetical protein
MRKIYLYIASFLHPNLVVCLDGFCLLEAFAYTPDNHLIDFERSMAGSLYLCHAHCTPGPYISTCPCYNPVCIYKGLHWTTQGQIVALFLRLHATRAMEEEETLGMPLAKQGFYKGLS